jgi:hypothetical protein
MWEWSYGITIPHLSILWRRVVNYTFRPLYSPPLPHWEIVRDNRWIGGSTSTIKILKCEWWT